MLKYHLPLVLIAIVVNRISAFALKSTRYYNEFSSLFMGATESDDNENDTQLIGESSVKIDDHGSNLTDRFKYKVNALMGKYDPIQTELDNEKSDGNILQAMINFPSLYVFNIVGRTNGIDKVTERYINDVKKIVFDICGDREIGVEYIARGKKFTKLKVETSVESASMITQVYKELAEHELTVMRF